MAHRRNRLAAVLLTLAVPAAALAPIAARGDAAPPKKTGALSAGGRAFTGLIEQGNAKAAARDFVGAIDAYRKAIELSPHQPLGHYLLGEAQLAAGNMAEAEASWTRAAAEANEADPGFRARVLFVLADLKERQKKWEEARAAWQVYLDWAGRFPDAGVFPESARSRQQVLDATIKNDKAVEAVRARIAATADGGTFSDPSKSPPAK